MSISLLARYYHYHRFSWWYLILAAVVIVVALVVYFVKQRARRAREDAFRQEMKLELSASSTVQQCSNCGQPNPAIESACVMCGSPLAGSLAAGMAAGPAAESPAPPPAAPPKTMGIIARDINIEGRQAFSQGEMVDIEGVNPDPRRPDFKYVVLSRTLNKRFLLSDKDVMA